MAGMWNLGDGECGMARLKQFLKSTKGATAIEYGLLASFIALAIYTGVAVAGDGARTMFNLIGEVMVNSIADK